jgi:hypothetical protein
MLSVCPRHAAPDTNIAATIYIQALKVQFLFSSFDISFDIGLEQLPDPQNPGNASKGRSRYHIGSVKPAMRHDFPRRKPRLR